MPIYVYETIPTDATEAPRRFEMKQSMKDPALTHAPGSGHPVRRVIQGGYLNTQRWTKSPGSLAAAPHASTGACCGIAGCGPH